MTGGEAVLQVEGVSKSYGSLKALDDFQLRLNAGEFVVLLGPNGAGKTTLFQMLSGLFVPDAGRIRVAGRDMSREAVQALAAIGVVFQQPALDLDLTVRANLKFHARLHGLGAAAGPRIDEELGRAGLADKAGAPARVLSGGNRRRVELARALLHRPRVLLMDEATVGLDPASRSQMLEHVAGLCRERGVAVLWATHLIDEAELADRVVILNRGIKRHEGRPEVLLQDAGDATLADLLVALSRENDTQEEKRA